MHPIVVYSGRSTCLQFCIFHLLYVFPRLHQTGKWELDCCNRQTSPTPDFLNVEPPTLQSEADTIRLRRMSMSVFQEIIKSNEGTILSVWIGELENSTRRSDLMNDADLRRQGTELLRLFTKAVQFGSDVQSEPFAATREFLKDVAKSRMEQGFTAAE